MKNVYKLVIVIALIGAGCASNPPVEQDRQIIEEDVIRLDATSEEMTETPIVDDPAEIVAPMSDKSEKPMRPGAIKTSVDLPDFQFLNFEVQVKRDYSYTAVVKGLYKDQNILITMQGVVDQITREIRARGERGQIVFEFAGTLQDDALSGTMHGTVFDQWVEFDVEVER